MAGERIPEAEAIEIRRLDPAEIDQDIDALAAVLADVVAGGASIGYMAPFSHQDARDAFTSFAAEVAHGRRLLLAGFLDGALVGTVQVILSAPPNQPHRGEITKLLVHRSGRRRGVARRLMERAETEALSAGKTLLVLDTADDTAERLYSRLGWTLVGVIPGFALFPDGRPCATTVFYKSLAA
jgi:GNAT superfamily N-acetyltransferase